MGQEPRSNSIVQISLESQHVQALPFGSRDGGAVIFFYYRQAGMAVPKPYPSHPHHRRLVPRMNERANDHDQIPNGWRKRARQQSESSLRYAPHRSFATRSRAAQHECRRWYTASSLLPKHPPNIIVSGYFFLRWPRILSSILQREKISLPNSPPVLSGEASKERWY